MRDVPETSVSLLKSLSQGAESRRWTEFYEKYTPSMRAFVMSRFPSLDPDDVLQETMLALAKCLAGYVYRPEDKGHFSSYLMGIVKHKAMDELSRRAHESSVRQKLAQNVDDAVREQDEQMDVSFRKAALEVAISQLMSDDSISPRTREVFRHVALMHEDPVAVADRFGITRNNVDQIKKRLVDRLGHIASRLCLEG